MLRPQSAPARLLDTVHAKLQWDSASVASQFKRVPYSGGPAADCSLKVCPYTLVARCWLCTRTHSPNHAP